MKTNAIVASLFTAMLLSGCTTFKYAGRDFRSEQQALAYQQEHLSGGINKIVPTQNKVGGTLRMYFVDQEVARSKMITGNATSVAGDYVLKTIFADTAKFKEAIERRKIFDVVDLRFANGLHRNAEPPDHVIYFFIESPQINSWYYIGSKVPRTPITVDRGSKEPDIRMMYLMESLEALASAEKFTSQQK